MGRRSKAVLALLKRDRWEGAEISTPSGPGLVRYRVPVLKGGDTAGYGRVLKVIWAYAAEGSGAMPSTEDSAQMQVFEGRFCEAVERDARAVLAAVLTFDGARQWVFYTDDVADCGARLGAMPQEAEPYPLELSAEDDPQWSYLRDEILLQVPYQR